MASRPPSEQKQGEALLRELGFLPEEALAGLLRVSPKTLRNRRDLPVRHKLGRRCVYKVADVQAWMARRAVRA